MPCGRRHFGCPRRRRNGWIHSFRVWVAEKWIANHRVSLSKALLGRAKRLAPGSKQMQDKHHANKTDTYEHLWEINKATVLWVALLYLSNEAKPLFYRAKRQESIRFIKRRWGLYLMCRQFSTLAPKLGIRHGLSKFGQHWLGYGIWVRLFYQPKCLF